jgi:hypothetical protein
MGTPNFVNGIYAERYLKADLLPVVTPTGTALAMSLGSVYMPPGIYTLYGNSWDCTQDGLYVFRNPANSFFVHRIVTPWNSPSTFDIYNFMSAVSYNHLHGVADEGSDNQAMSNGGIYHRWRMRCGVICGMIAWTLPQSVWGITTRVRNVSTLGPKNGFDDGHLVIETLHGGLWRMWDLTNGCYFRDTSGNHMSLSDFMAVLVASPLGLPTKVLLSPLLSKISDDVAVGYNWDYGRQRRLWDDPAYSEAWYRRIFQVIVS